MNEESRAERSEGHVEDSSFNPSRSLFSTSAVRVFSGEDCIEGRWHEPIFPKFAAVCTLSNKIVWLNLERPKRSPFLFQIRMKPSMTDFHNSSMQILSFLPRDN